MFFRAVGPPFADGEHKAPVLREAQSFMAAHATCMRCRRAPSSVVMSHGDRKVAVCRECHEWFNAPPAPPRRDDPAAARARAERAAQMRAIVNRL